MWEWLKDYLKDPEELIAEQNLTEADLAAAAESVQADRKIVMDNSLSTFQMSDMDSIIGLRHQRTAERLKSGLLREDTEVVRSAARTARSAKKLLVLAR